MVTPQAVGSDAARTRRYGGVEELFAHEPTRWQQHGVASPALKPHSISKPLYARRCGLLRRRDVLGTWRKRVHGEGAAVHVQPPRCALWSCMRRLRRGCRASTQRELAGCCQRHAAGSYEEA